MLLNSVMESPRLSLVPVEEKYMSHLFKYRNQKDYMDFCTSRRKFVTYEEFLDDYSKEFIRGRHMQFMIIRKSDGQVLGTEFSYGFNLYDGYIFLTIYLEKEYRIRGYAPESLVIFVDFLFQSTSLNKIYMDVYEYNHLSLNTLKKRGLIQEGCFKEHRVYNGERHNQYRFALYKKDFSGIHKSIFNICERLVS